MGKIIAIITLGLAGVAIIAFVLLRFILFTPFYLSGDSMEPAFSAGAAVVVNKTDRSFDRGDIVVAKDQDKKNGFLIRRVVGMPGEEIEIADGLVFINGEKFPEDYTKGTFSYDESYGFALKDNRDIIEYLLLPDNRETAEARNILPTNADDIVGFYSPQMTDWFESILNLSK